MSPVNLGFGGPLFAGAELVEAASEQNVFHALDAKRNHGGLDRFGGAGPAVERRVGDSQALGGDGFVVGNQLDDFFQLDVVRIGAKQVQERIEYGGRRRQGAQPFDPF